MQIDSNNVNGLSTGATSSQAVRPTNPFHVSRAYGVAAPARVDEIRQAPASVVIPSGPRRLVAGVVRGGIEFGSGHTPETAPTEARPAQQPLAMYRHPADKNAAATAVNVGRRLDVQG